LSSYTDILAVRSFPSLTSKEDDYQEKLLKACLEYSDKPVISLESATRHPLQSLTDVMTISEFGIKKPKIAVTWAPHPKCLPQAVVNSFLEWSQVLEADVWLAHPDGYELDEQFTNGVNVTNSQEEALRDADFVYCKNWSSYSHYGQNLGGNEHWTVTKEKMNLTKNGKFMHCLPVRRNIVVTDEVLDNSIVYQQAANRVWAAQAVIKEILKG
jgi:N-succinyl-L-ornithine transcarbamylase